MQTAWPGPRALGVTAQLYDPASGAFVPTNPYSDVPQTNLFPCPLATLLPDGKVLTNWNESEAELYDPRTASFHLTRGVVNDYYGVYTATLLTTGKVLITTETNTELYDPKTEAFSVTGAPPLYSTFATIRCQTVQSYSREHARDYAIHPAPALSYMTRTPGRSPIPRAERRRASRIRRQCCAMEQC